MKVRQKASLFGLLTSVMTLTISSTAAAHVVVKPTEVPTSASFQTFTMSVPNEKTVPTTSLKLDIPAGLSSVTPTQKSGWNIDVQKNGTGEDATVTSITWSGNTIGVGLRDDFTFSAQLPKNPTDLTWKAYQTYADGAVVSWDKSGGEDVEGGNSGPFSVTKVVADTAETIALKEADKAAADAKDEARRAQTYGVAGIAVGLVGIFFATRRKQR